MFVISKTKAVFCFPTLTTILLLNKKPRLQRINIRLYPYNVNSCSTLCCDFKMLSSFNIVPQ